MRARADRGYARGSRGGDPAGGGGRMPGTGAPLDHGGDAVELRRVIVARKPPRQENQAFGANMGRFLVLDSWRGIAACLVALFHLDAYSHLYGVPFLRNSWLFVDFFFVLSGFVIAANYQQRLLDGFGVGRFLFLRLGRLYPLHFAMLALFVGWDLMRSLRRVLSPELAPVALF